jgi:hypothetical protein
MTLTAGHYTVDKARLPMDLEEARAGLTLQAIRGKKEIALIHPNAQAGYEPNHVRYMCGLGLSRGNGDVAQRMGQVVVTGRRVIGMVTDGSFGDIKLSEDSGSIYVFAFELDDIGDPQVKSNWRRKPIEVVLRSREGGDAAFSLVVFSLSTVVKNDGSLVFCSLKSFLDNFTPAGRRELMDQA